MPLPQLDHLAYIFSVHHRVAMVCSGALFVTSCRHSEKNGTDVWESTHGSDSNVQERVSADHNVWHVTNSSDSATAIWDQSSVGPTPKWIVWLQHRVTYGLKLYSEYLA